MDQRFVHDLDGGAAAAPAGLHDQQARLDQLIDEALDPPFSLDVSRSSSIAHGARALGGDQAQQDRAQLRSCGSSCWTHAVGVAHQRAGDAAQRAVGLLGQHCAADVARLPELRAANCSSGSAAGVDSRCWIMSSIIPGASKR